MSADMEEKLVKQVEYYFGDINLPRDRFLQEEMRMNGDGWVRLGELMKFNRLKQICSDDTRVMEILGSKCALLEVDAGERRVRRRPERALPRDKVAFSRDLLPRSVYVKGFLREATLDDIQAYFVRCGVEPEAIRMRRRRGVAGKDDVKRTASNDEEDDDDEGEGDAAPEGDKNDGKTKFTLPFKGSVFAIFRTVADSERFLKAAQATSDPQADAALFDSATPFEKKSKDEYFRAKKQSTKAKRRGAQAAFDATKKGKSGDATKAAEGVAQPPGERPFERGMLLRLTDVPQALLDFNELKKLFTTADVDIFADLIQHSNAAVIRIKRAPSGVPDKDAKVTTVGAAVWGKLCGHFNKKEESPSTDAFPVLNYKNHTLHAELISGDEENRFWKDLFAKWENDAATKQPRKGGKGKGGKGGKMGKGKRKWNDKGKRNGGKRGECAGDDGESDGDTRPKRAKACAGDDDDGDE